MDIVIRATVVFCFLLFLTRIVGRRELSTMEPFDLILLVVLGDFVQQGVTQNDFSVTGALIASGTIAILVIFTSWIGFRLPFSRPILEGEPVILLEDGKPIERNLRRNRITPAELAAAARQEQGVASLDDVRWAVLETNGRISIIRR